MLDQLRAHKTRGESSASSTQLGLWYTGASSQRGRGADGHRVQRRRQRAGRGVQCCCDGRQARQERERTSSTRLSRLHDVDCVGAWTPPCASGQLRRWPGFFHRSRQGDRSTPSPDERAQQCCAARAARQCPWFVQLWPRKNVRRIEADSPPSQTNQHANQPNSDPCRSAREGEPTPWRAF